MTLQEEIKKLDYKGIAVLLAIALALGVIYGTFFIQNMFLGIIAMIIAVFGSYYVLSSFFEEEKPVNLEPGERMILRTLDRAYMMFPKKRGFLTAESKRDLSVYLTDKRLFAKKSSGETVFEKPLSSLAGVSSEKRLMAKCLRLRYYSEGREKEVLLFAGDNDLWIKRLGELGIKEKDVFEDDSEENDDNYAEDSRKLKNTIGQKNKQ
jgi:hypothetical protein